MLENKKMYVLLLGFFTIFFMIKAEVEVGEFPPSFRYFDSHNQKIDLKEYMDSKPVVISFFATYCFSCRREIPFLVRASHNNKRFQLILVASDTRNKKKISRFLRKIRVPNAPFIYDPTQRIYENFRIKGLPTTIFIGKSGRIVAVEVGFTQKKVGKYNKIISELWKK